MPSRSGLQDTAHSPLTLPRMACLVFVVLFALTPILLDTSMLSAFGGEWEDAMFYPFSILHLILPWPTSELCWLILHVIVGGMGTFLLMECWTRNASIATIAAFVFASFLFQNHIAPTDMAALAWLPWILRWAELAWASGGASLLVCAVVAAMQLLTGSVQVVILSYVSLAVIALGTMTPKAGSVGLALKRTAALTAIVAVLAATQIVPLTNLQPRIRLKQETERIRDRKPPVSGNISLTGESPQTGLQLFARR